MYENMFKKEQFKPHKRRLNVSEDFCRMNYFVG